MMQPDDQRDAGQQGVLTGVPEDVADVVGDPGHEAACRWYRSSAASSPGRSRALDDREDLVGADGAGEGALVVDEDSPAGRRGERGVEDGAQGPVDAGDGAAAVEHLAVDGAAETVRFDPAERLAVAVDDEQPAVVARGLGLVGGGAEGDGRLGGQLQVRRLVEAERTVAAVAADEAGHEVVDRVRQQVCGFGQLRELAPDPEDSDLVAELDGLVDVVRDEEDRLAQLALEAEELVLELVADDRVDRRERLVHEHHRRVGRQRTGDADPLLLAAGELAGVALGERRVEADALEQLHRPVTDLLLVPAEQLGHGADVVEHGPVREEARVLDHVADASPHLGGVHLPGVLVVQPDRPGGGFDHPVDHAERGRLAAPGGSDENGDLTGRSLEVEMVDRRGAAGVLLRDVVEANHDVDPKRDE